MTPNTDPVHPAPLLTLWIGQKIGVIQRACHRSALAQGHEVALYCYEVPDGVPSGVVLRDAATILPRDEIIRYPNGSPALFANRFRYELLHRVEDVWIDCDLYFVAPLISSDAYIMGDQGGGKINTAVLRLPSDSAVLSDLRALFSEPNVPTSLAWRERLAARFRLFATGRHDVARMPWGSTGPEALTWLAKAHGLLGHVAPPARFYPVPWTDAAWIYAPDRPLESVLGPDTVAVHLWNERLRVGGAVDVLPRSFAARLHGEGALP